MTSHEPAILAAPRDVKRYIRGDTVALTWIAPEDAPNYVRTQIWGASTQERVMPMLLGVSYREPFFHRHVAGPQHWCYWLRAEYSPPSYSDFIPAIPARLQQQSRLRAALRAILQRFDR
jgi:hypothetical protein